MYGNVQQGYVQGKITKARGFTGLTEGIASKLELKRGKIFRTSCDLSL